MMTQKSGLTSPLVLERTMCCCIFRVFYDNGCTTSFACLPSFMLRAHDRYVSQR